MERNITFEEAMERLEQITQQMEDAELPLEKLASLYKEGLELYQYCQRKLDMTEKELIVLAEGGSNEA